MAREKKLGVEESDVIELPLRRWPAACLKDGVLYPDADEAAVDTQLFLCKMLRDVLFIAARGVQPPERHGRDARPPTKVHDGASDVRSVATMSLTAGGSLRQDVPIVSDQ